MLDIYPAQVLANSIDAMDGSGFITRQQADSLLESFNRLAPVDDLTLDDFTCGDDPHWIPFDNGARFKVAIGWLGLDPPASPASSVVYFVQCGAGGPVKIGRTCDIARRLAELQTASPHPLALLAATRGGARLERIFHDEFRYTRIHGEWFTPSTELLALIAEIAGTKP